MKQFINKPMSLQKQLLYIIQSQGEATLNELYEASTGYKQSNCERALRHLSEGDEALIKPTKNLKGYITGYIYV